MSCGLAGSYGGTLSRQLARAEAHEPEVDGITPLSPYTTAQSRPK